MSNENSNFEFELVSGKKGSLLFPGEGEYKAFYTSFYESVRNDLDKQRIARAKSMDSARRYWIPARG